MRLTCLKCGHQFEVATGPGGYSVGCICGTEFEAPGVLDTGVEPSVEAAERLRSKAFRAAGLVKNVGGFAFGIAALGLLFFPLGIIGAGIGVYCLTMLRGPVARYSGRKWATIAIAVGASVFFIEGAVAFNWLQTRRAQEQALLQQTVKEDLKRLRRAQVLQRANHGFYGSFKDFRFKPATGRYTVYLGETEYFPGKVDGAEIIAPLPEGFAPGYGVDDFTAVAVANLDGDDGVDVWMMTSATPPHHVVNDLEEMVVPLEEVEPESGANVGAGGGGEQDAGEGGGDGGDGSDETDAEPIDDDLGGDDVEP